MNNQSITGRGLRWRPKIKAVPEIKPDRMSVWDGVRLAAKPPQPPILRGLMERFGTIAIYVFVAVAITFCTIHACQRHQYRRELDAMKNHAAAREAMLNEVEKELTLRGADDCILESTSYGFSCKEIKTGKIFKIKL